MPSPPFPGNILGWCGIFALVEAANVPFARFVRRSLIIATERFRARPLDASSRKDGAGDSSLGLLPMPLPYPEAELSCVSVDLFSRTNSRKVKIRRACKWVNRIIAVLNMFELMARYRHRRDFYSLIARIETGYPNAAYVLCVDTYALSFRPGVDRLLLILEPDQHRQNLRT